MPNWLSVFLMFLGAVLVLCAAFNVPSPPRVNLGWMGIFCWMLVFLVERLGG